VFQDEAPLLRAHAHPAFADTWTAAVNLLLLKAMGAGPTGRITYAARGRLDGIGRGAIGDMVSSAVSSSSGALAARRATGPRIIARDRGSRKHLQRSQTRNDSKST
jgi:hypothetical protein